MKEFFFFFLRIWFLTISRVIVFRLLMGNRIKSCRNLGNIGEVINNRFFVLDVRFRLSIILIFVYFSPCFPSMRWKIYDEKYMKCEKCDFLARPLTL